MNDLPSRPNPESPKRLFPLLTDEQKRALFEQEDRGVISAPLKQFATYEEWRVTHGRRNFLQNWFCDGEVNDMRRQMQCYQRFELLYPELIEELKPVAEAYVAFEEASPDGHARIDETADRKLLEAYIKMSSLMDTRDDGINNGIPNIVVDSHILLR